jgi:hypothetical protein
MDTRTFIVEIIKALAWPLAVVIAVLAFRKSILRLLPHLTTFKYDKFEVQFAKEVAAVEREAQAALPPVPQTSRHEAVREQLMSLAMSSPESAIIETWRYLETQFIEAANRHKLDIAPAVRTMPMVIAALLYKDDVITEAQQALIRRLRDLRNEVTHTRPGMVDIERATSYIESAIRLAASLNEKQASEKI